jgi:hypothetical protein
MLARILQFYRRAQLLELVFIYRPATGRSKFANSLAEGWFCKIMMSSIVGYLWQDSVIQILCHDVVGSQQEKRK